MISIEVKKLVGLNKAFGLIAKHKTGAVYFQTRFGIHTFGMKFPIDVIILDDDFRIVILKKNLLPNRIFVWKFMYKNVIEIPSEEKTIQYLKIGDKINPIFR